MERSFITGTHDNKHCMHFSIRSGKGEPFPGLERVVIGMTEEESRAGRIPADEVFAGRAEDLDSLLPTKRDLAKQEVVFTVQLIGLH